MSKTRHHSRRHGDVRQDKEAPRQATKRRAAGYEYWTARPGNANGGVPGPFTKKKTHRVERRQGKKQERFDTESDNV